MRRVGSTFVTLWLVFLLPSLVVWGFMVRWSESSAARFESIWRWCADRLAFPLVFSPATDWSWIALREGGTASATSGFLLLTSVWALMLALPLALIGGWWVWISHRLAKSSPTPAASSSMSYLAPFDSTLSLPASTAPPSGGGPSGALYLITLPIALVWSGFRALFTPRRIDHPFVKWWLPIVRASGLVFVLTLIAYWVYWLSVDTRGLDDAARFLLFTVWEGYLDLFRIPAFFEGQYRDAIWSFRDGFTGSSAAEWDQHTLLWFLDPDLRQMGLILAFRHALGAAIAALALRILGSIF